MDIPIETILNFNVGNKLAAISPDDIISKRFKNNKFTCKSIIYQSDNEIFILKKLPFLLKREKINIDGIFNFQNLLKKDSLSIFIAGLFLLRFGFNLLDQRNTLFTLTPKRFATWAKLSPSLLRIDSTFFRKSNEYVIQEIITKTKYFSYMSTLILPCPSLSHPFYLS